MLPKAIPSAADKNSEPSHTEIHTGTWEGEKKTSQKKQNINASITGQSGGWQRERGEEKLHKSRSISAVERRTQ